MKTAEEWIAGNRILTMGDVKTIQLEAYRAGMEAAARMCREAKVGLGVGNCELTSAEERHIQAGCMGCSVMLEHAAKTAQLT